MIVPINNAFNSIPVEKQCRGIRIIRKTDENKYECLGEFKRVPDSGVGEMSDGYHTFNELYHHKAVLFSIVCSQFKHLAWKSKLHYTGDMYDDMFIVGITTPVGQATYHFNIDPYWDMFDVNELERAPKWDGYTPDEAIKRLEYLRNL